MSEIGPSGGNTVLLQHQGWRGVRFDGDEVNLDIDLHKEFVTPQSIVALFRRYNVPIDVDYVSIDVDSCDLWVFLALTDVYRPAVVSVEYNSNYEINESLTNVCARPQDGFFQSTKFTKGHWGWSASIKAFYKAANHRGYSLVWVEPLFDVFLVRTDLICQAHLVPPLKDFAFAAGLKLHVGRMPCEKDRKGHWPCQKTFDDWIVEYWSE
eukprot:gnl/TRDRNA2_/TRDRNA2_137206_c0_seq1.p1 gnl/TRDRNA2_/TRDRNA2_137206_c0~~gnl/TRDRNA2_/TRDRNA2_137206_c0_seq1.p1  ORF type:complete len:241 (-),score=24.91 gnl/TRDRNA2_/TRDRNA2_137206_c0_seq1:66-695(-)